MFLRESLGVRDNESRLYVVVLTEAIPERRAIWLKQLLWIDKDKCTVPGVCNHGYILLCLLKTCCYGLLQDFPSGLLNEGLRSKRVLDYDLGVCSLKEVKSTAQILIILAF